MNLQQIESTLCNIESTDASDIQTFLRIGMSVGDIVKDIDQLGFDGLNKLKDILMERCQNLRTRMTHLSRGPSGDAVSGAGIAVEVYDILVSEIEPRLKRRRTWEEIERHIQHSLMSVKDVRVEQLPHLVKLTLDGEVAYLDPSELPFPRDQTASKLFNLQMLRDDNHAK